MNWLRRAPSPEKMVVDKTVQKLDAAREKKRSALRELVRALDEIPLDDGLVKIGNEMLRKEAD
jgi:hypothetical protein